jgi:hypothetical protein
LNQGREKNKVAMIRAISLSIAAISLLAIAPSQFRAQEQFQFESDLLAQRRVFDAVGPGFRAIHRSPNGNYYILTAPSAAVQIYDAAGKRLGQIPAETAAKGVSLVYGESFDVDRDGNLAVSDRGSGAVKIFLPNGSLATTIPVSGPASVALLPGGEIAIASPNMPRLVAVYDLAGRQVREYGDREEVVDNSDINNKVNLGRLEGDQAGNTYFAFDYLPEPTARKFDPSGYLTMEISLKTLEFQPAAQSARRAIARSDRGMPALHRIVTALGVDPETQEVWLAIGTLLMQFDKEGQRLATFRTYLPGGGRMEASTILVERDRLLLGADPQGIYQFPHPAKIPQ